MVFPFKEKGFFVFFCVWLLFWIANIVDNIIWDTTSGIKAKVRVDAMVGEKGKGSGIEKFDGTYFAYWRMQIEDYFYEKKLHLPLLGTKLETMKDEDWNLLDRQVVGVIWLTLSRSVAHNIVKEKTIVDLMKALSSMYEKSSANNKVYQMKKLFNLKKVEGIPIA